MTKFTFEFRKNMVEERMSGKTYAAIYKEHGVGHKTVREWVARYKNGGMEQLIQVNKKTYSQNFKKMVIDYRWQNGASFMQTAMHFKIPNSGIICKWERKYMTEGIAGLKPLKRGRKRKARETHT